MNITRVNIYRVKGSGSLKAFASITIDDEFIIHGLRIFEGKNGLFVSMPGKKVGEKYIDIAHPITAEIRKKITNMVLEAFHKEVKKAV